MTEKSLKYLHDILLAINLIEDFMAGIDSFELYKLDLKTQSAVERQLAFIGETLNKFRIEDAHGMINNDHQIIAFRNRLIHSYGKC